MRKFFIGLGALALMGAAFVPAAASASPGHGAQGGAPAPNPHDPGELVAVPGTRGTGPTVQVATLKVTSGGKNFNMQLVGTDPRDAAHPTSTINVKIIPVSWSFTDGVTLDPTATLPSCAGGGTPLNRLLNSVIVKNFTINGHGRQFVEEFRREEFWSFAKPGGSNANYSVHLNFTVLPKFNGTVSGPSTHESCGHGGHITMSSIDSLIKSTILPHYGSAIKTTDFPILLFTNIGMCNNAGCGVGGYHSSFARNGGTQTYGTAGFFTDHEFSSFADTSVPEHEISEWLDDPFVNNLVPTFQPVGQLSSCGTLYETGDPLTGTLFSFHGSHFQDLAEFSWFFRFVPSLGVTGNTYSLFGTFRSPSSPC